MQKWIGTLEQGTIAGLFDTDKTSSITVDQQQSLELAEGDLVTVTDAAPEVITPPGASAQTPVSAATDIIQFELLAPVGSSAATVYRVLAEKNLDPHHSVRCEQEAREWQQHPGHDAPELHDLTALPFVTIDNADHCTSIMRWQMHLTTYDRGRPSSARR